MGNNQFETYKTITLPSTSPTLGACQAVRDRVALINGFSLFDKIELKKLLLLFDRIGLTDGHLWQAWKTALEKEYKDYVDDFEWLQDNGWIVDLTLPSIEEQRDKLCNDRVFLDQSQRIGLLVESTKIDSALAWLAANRDRPLDAPITLEEARFARFMNRTRHHLTRIHSVVLNKLCEFRTVPVIPFRDTFDQGHEERQAEVFHIVLKHLPIPGNSVAYTDIIDFRRDGETQYYLEKMRNWASKTARGNLSPSEIEEEIEWLLMEYKRHISINKLRTQSSAIEFVLTTAGDTVENLLRFRWGKIAKDIFSLRYRKIEKMEAEMAAPGSEVAFISKTREVFKQKT